LIANANAIEWWWWGGECKKETKKVGGVKAGRKERNKRENINSFVRRVNQRTIRRRSKRLNGTTTAKG
jgi:hypothetical protein